MLKKIYLATGIVALFFTACKKDNSTNNNLKGSVSVIYNGTTINFDSVYYRPENGATNIHQIVAFNTGSAIMTGSGTWMTIDCVKGISVGTQADTSAIPFFGSLLYLNDVYVALPAYTLTITSNANNKLSGSFSGTGPRGAVTATFSNLILRQ
jgi:hypothetical protein